MVGVLMSSSVPGDTCQSLSRTRPTLDLPIETATRYEVGSSLDEEEQT
jgi:hypothetical protein